MNFWDEIKIVHMMVFFTRTSIADENNVFFSSVIGGGRMEKESLNFQQ